MESRSLRCRLRQHSVIRGPDSDRAMGLAALKVNVRDCAWNPGRSPPFRQQSYAALPTPSISDGH